MIVFWSDLGSAGCGGVTLNLLNTTGFHYFFSEINQNGSEMLKFGPNDILCVPLLTHQHRLSLRIIFQKHLTIGLL